MSIDPTTLSLAETVVAAARARNLTVTTAESCTGGMVAAALTEVAGASDVFGYGFVTYANAAKTDLINVPTDLIAQHGAVSSEVALAMAEGARVKADADIAVSITGIAGPSGGTADKPVGLVYIAIASADDPTKAHRHTFENNERASIRMEATQCALTLLLQAIDGDGGT